MAAEKRSALGRGLSALIPDRQPPAIAPSTQPATEPPGGGSSQAEGPGAVASHELREGRQNIGQALEVDLDLLDPNPLQPRAHFDDRRLDELARSLRASGVIQPLVTRRRGERYQIIAGERRWRAAQRAGLLKVPVVLRDVPDEKLLEVALIENLQREDLNAIDEALAYRRLVEEFHLTQEQIADAVGKDRASIANHLRLLKLPAEVRQLVAGAALSMGHARAIVGLDDHARMKTAAREALDRHLSVRETEALVRRLLTPAKPTRTEPSTDVHTRHAEERMRLALGTRVRIVRAGKGGRIEIDFISEEELNRIYERITEPS
ncbi:MAG: ParB/RepB/Spo0J family partition protein [Luteitalea sp.]|nr:ParB/RepB/Spo0J family partition protein [Luteitalea sp.]